MVGLVIGLTLGNALTNRVWYADSAKRGYAQYHKQTGAWEWVPKAKKAEVDDVGQHN
jgi:hypothetical protein